MVNIIDSIVPICNHVRPGWKKEIKWIVIHETDNTDNGANALAHAKYLQNMAKYGKSYVSWQYSVDKDVIYRHIPDDEVAWHAGDSTNEGGGNMCGIGIELCVNADGDFTKTMQNAIDLVASICKKYNLTVDNVVRQHNAFSGKNCPSRIRAKAVWNEFILNCKDALNKLNNPVVRMPFPGTRFFGNGCNNQFIELLGKMLIKAGYGRFYKVGASKDWGKADKNAVMAFQKAQGWTGGGADGYPGKMTWEKLCDIYYK